MRSRRCRSPRCGWTRTLLGAARRLGLERIGELLAMPRAPLQRRFGETLLLRLDQALGRAPEPFEPIVPEAAAVDLLRFLEPIATAEAIAEASGRGGAAAGAAADARPGSASAASSCSASGSTMTRRPSRSALARATRDGAHLHNLLCAKIETIEPGFGIERLRLVAARVEPLAAAADRGRAGRGAAASRTSPCWSTASPRGSARAACTG